MYHEVQECERRNDQAGDINTPTEVCQQKSAALPFPVAEYIRDSVFRRNPGFLAQKNAKAHFGSPWIGDFQEKTGENQKSAHGNVPRRPEQAAAPLQEAGEPVQKSLQRASELRDVSGWFRAAGGLEKLTV